MRQIFSLIMLWTRRSILRTAVLALLTAAAQTVLFALAMRGGGSLEDVLYKGRPGIAAAVGFLLLCAQLYLVGGNFGSRQDYTLDRLAVGRGAGFACRWAASALCVFVFWGAQAAAALWLCRLYSLLGGSPGPQAAVLAFYRNRFLHALLPLAERGGYVRNAFICAALGAESAGCGGKKRLFGIMPFAVLIWFRHPLGSLGLDVWICLFAAAVAAFSIFRLRSPHGEEEADEALQ
ncbi:MAG: hypothetical protein IKE62_01340 [Oscillospiraceae bacterium]|nr:hypothetical protein [Oscillospiraceae bacterium]